MGKILTFGSLNVDYVYHVPHFVAPVKPWPLPNERSTAAERASISPLPLPGRVQRGISCRKKSGADGQIHRPICLVKAAWIFPNIQHSSGPSGHAIIQVDPSGQTASSCLEEAIRRSPPRKSIGFSANFGPGDRIILQNEINNLSYIMQQAAARGLDIVFNPSPIDASSSLCRWSWSPCWY